MKKMVKCPLCGKLYQTRGKHYFRCCQMAWEVEKCQVSSYDEARYTVPTKNSKDKDYIIVVDESGRKLNDGEIKKLIRETVSEAMKRGLEKQKPKVEKLVIEPPEPSDEDLY